MRNVTRLIAVAGVGLSLVALAKADEVDAIHSTAPSRPIVGD